MVVSCVCELISVSVVSWADRGSTVVKVLCY